jgi:type VI secretion system secreted protein VgrG
VATVTPESIQNTAGNNIIQTAQNSVDISAFKRFMVNAGNRISLFASKMGITIFAAQGKIDIQAQNDELHLTGNKHVKLTSVGHEVTVSACNKLTLSCGDSAIIIEPDNIKLMSLGDIRTFSTSFGSFGPETLSVSPPQLPEGAHCEEQL